MKSKEEIRELLYQYSMLMYDCYSKVWDLCAELPHVIDIDGNSPRKAEMLQIRDELYQLHLDSMEYVNTDLL
jgi:hypothetical protein